MGRSDRVLGRQICAWCDHKVDYYIMREYYVGPAKGRSLSQKIQHTPKVKDDAEYATFVLTMLADHLKELALFQMRRERRIRD